MTNLTWKMNDHDPSSRDWQVVLEGDEFVILDRAGRPILRTCGTANRDRKESNALFAVQSVNGEGSE